MAEVVVALVGDEMKASVACGKLTAAGIRAYHRPASGGFYDISGSTASGAWVPQDIIVDSGDAPAAKDVLDDRIA